MKNNLIFKNISIIIAMPILGFILLNLTFMFDALFQSILRTILRKFITFNYNTIASWIPISMHMSFALLILVISWFILKSKLKDLYKAVYSPVPVAVILVTEGIFLYHWSAVVYIVGALTYGIIILYLYKTKKSWYFYYSVSWITLALLIIGILGVDI
jgi:hypothetical protein